MHVRKRSIISFQQSMVVWFFRERKAHPHTKHIQTHSNVPWLLYYYYHHIRCLKYRLLCFFGFGKPKTSLKLGTEFIYVLYVLCASYVYPTAAHLSLISLNFYPYHEDWAATIWRWFSIFGMEKFPSLSNWNTKQFDGLRRRRYEKNKFIFLRFDGAGERK